jgi:hypothetical protein
MKILPILWGSPPTPADWKRLSAAREAIGYEEQVKPAVALPGSPGRILALGERPTWLTPYQYLVDTGDPRLPEVLKWCLDESIFDPFAPTFEDMIDDWSGGTFKFVGEEPVDA